jgi:hypothetical protein
MGRPRKYATDAERQAAYRARLPKDRTWTTADRHYVALLEARLDRMHHAIRCAADHGDVLAGSLRAGSTDTCIDKITSWFEGLANAPAQKKGTAP